VVSDPALLIVKLDQIHRNLHHDICIHENVKVRKFFPTFGIDCSRYVTDDCAFSVLQPTLLLFVNCFLHKLTLERRIEQNLVLERPYIATLSRSLVVGIGVEI
jgi:hypothetical protein